KILEFGLARIDEAGRRAGHAGHRAGHVGHRFSGASAIAGVPDLTQPGVVIGTPAYMAPEQINGLAVDARADVFAFGVLLYEFACGVHPFAAATPLGTVARVLESDVAPLSSLVDVPAPLVEVLARCLHK